MGMFPILSSKPVLATVIFIFLPLPMTSLYMDVYTAIYIYTQTYRQTQIIGNKTAGDAMAGVIAYERGC